MGRFAVQEISKGNIKVRLAIAGPSGSGKTRTALEIAHCLGTSIIGIDTEQGSMKKYHKKNSPTLPFDFRVIEISENEGFAPQTYIEAIEAAEAAGADVIIIDSFSHAWMGKGGALEIHDRFAQKKNSFQAWRDVTPLHNALVNKILRTDAHVVVTLRSKTEYVVNQDDKGKTVIEEKGTAPVQREGVKYEFDVFCTMDVFNILTVDKTRCYLLDQNERVQKPGREFGERLRAWVDGGAPPSPKERHTEQARAAAPPPPNNSPTPGNQPGDTRIAGLITKIPAVFRGMGCTRVDDAEMAAIAMIEEKFGGTAGLTDDRFDEVRNYLNTDVKAELRRQKLLPDMGATDGA